MYFQYGGLVHPDNEVNVLSFTKNLETNPRGFGDIRDLIMNLEVTLIGVGATTALMQADLKDRMAVVEGAYSVHGYDAALYHDNGTISQHFINSSATLGGVFVSKFEYNKNEGEEYSTQRVINITLEAQARAGGDGIRHFSETVSISGDGGPRHVITEVMNGSPQKQITNQRTRTTASQTGEAVGLLGWPTPSRPMFQDMVRPSSPTITKTSPRRHRNAYLDWTISWSYNFESAGRLIGAPSIG